MKHKNELRASARAFWAVLLPFQFILLHGCGGGGGGASTSTTPPNVPPPGLTFSVDKTSLEFVAGRPNMTAPLGQMLMGSVSGQVTGTLYIFINVSGTAVQQPPPVTVNAASQTGQAYITVPAPSVLGAGTHTSNLQVRACLNDSTCRTGELSGSPQNVTVTYLIGSATPSATVAPYVVPSGRAGKVVLRGTGLAATTSVNFGQIAGTVDTASATELLVSYPSMPASTYGITLNGGSVTFGGSLRVVDVPAFLGQTLLLPPNTSDVLRLVYDTERTSLFAVAVIGANRTLMKYSYRNGQWQDPVTKVIPSLADIALSTDGSRLFVTSGTTLLALDPETLSTVRTTTAPLRNDSQYPDILQRFAFANDGVAVVSTGPRGLVGWGQMFYYFSDIDRFGQANGANLTPYTHTSGWYPVIGGNLRGTRVLVNPLGSSNNSVAEYRASGVLTLTSIALPSMHGQAIAMDAGGSRVVSFSSTTVIVSDDQLHELARMIMPADVTTATINPFGTRMYVQCQNNQLLTFDLTATPTAGRYPQVGSALTSQSPSYDPYFDQTTSIITPDGNTLFIAGKTSIVIVPAPQ